ncbi:MAG: ADP-glyceromanno-heptose 6-epimerase [Planctomycetes bacterium]|nr:ADP-glyceromanno-heptose 6-epimerase [Planctomycetota bacterium]
MIIVTGGAGFIGSNLLKALEKRDELVVVDWLGENNKWRNIAKRELYDVVRPEDLFDFLKGREDDVQAVFHMGAISATTEANVDAIVKNNVRLSLDLFRWCGLNKVRFLYASSAATYGDGSNGFCDDDTIDALASLSPLNAYGWSKHVVDRRIARVLRSGGSLPPQCVGLKFFNVYGPNEYHKENMRSVVHQLHGKIRVGEDAILFRSHNSEYSDGGQLRDFVYVKDIVDMMIWFLDNPEVQGLYNAGTGQARSFLDLANAVYSAMGKQPKIKFVDTPVEIRDKYQYFTEANMSKLQEAGFGKSATSLEDGVRDYVLNYLEQADCYL